MEEGDTTLTSRQIAPEAAGVVRIKQKRAWGNPSPCVIHAFRLLAARIKRRFVVARIVVSANGHQVHCQDAVTGPRCGGRFRQRAIQIPACSQSSDIGIEHGRRRDGGGLFAVFQRPLLLGCIDLAKIVDASIGLRRLTRPDEVRDRNRCQQTNDRHNDHDFHKGETRFAGVVDFHTILCLSVVCGVNAATDGLFISSVFRSLIACCHRNSDPKHQQSQCQTVGYASISTPDCRSSCKSIISQSFRSPHGPPPGV
jgi:hypothetical protein